MPGERFVDAQLPGLTSSGTTPTSSRPSAGGTLMRDTVRYALPFGPLGEVAHRAVVARDLGDLAFRARY